MGVKRGGMISLSFAFLAVSGELERIVSVFGEIEGDLRLVSGFVPWLLGGFGVLSGFRFLSPLVHILPSLFGLQLVPHDLFEILHDPLHNLQQYRVLLDHLRQRILVLPQHLLRPLQLELYLFVFPFPMFIVGFDKQIIVIEHIFHLLVLGVGEVVFGGVGEGADGAGRGGGGGGGGGRGGVAVFADEAAAGEHEFRGLGEAFEAEAGGDGHERVWGIVYG